MQAWERDILEYRPTVGFTPDIQSIVLEKPEGAPAVFRPSTMALQATKMLGTDLAENTVASLSRAANMRNQLDRCLANTPAYQAYANAKKAGNVASMKQALYQNVTDLQGNPQFDVYPMIDDLVDEMQTLMSFISDQLFDNKLDIGNLDQAREAEESKINTIFYREASGKPVDYYQLRNRTRTIAVIADRAQTHEYALNEIEGYLLSGKKELFHGDAQSFVYHLASMPAPKLTAVQDALGISFSQASDRALSSIVNQDRVGDRAFREHLDQQYKAVKDRFNSTFLPLLPHYTDDTIDDAGASVLQGYMSLGLETLSNTYEQLTVDHISNSTLNRAQLQSTFANLLEKKNIQLLHQTVGKFAEEFDPIDLEKEVARFIKNTRLNVDGSICG